MDGLYDSGRMLLPMFGVSQEEFFRNTITQLIDGRFILVDLYSATVIWNGKPRTIDVQALGNSTLIGMRLLAGHDVAIRATDGGPVSIAAIP